jgi:hypothetical protein
MAMLISNIQTYLQTLTKLASAAVRPDKARLARRRTGGTPRGERMDEAGDIVGCHVGN